MNTEPPQEQQVKETLPGHWLMCIAAFVLPLYGAIFGIYAMQRKDPAWQRTGKCTLIAGLVNTVVGVCVVIAVVGGLIHGAIVIHKELSSIGDPSSNHVDVQIASWSRGKMVDKEYVDLAVKVVTTNKDTVEMTIAPKDFWLVCVNNANYPAMGYGKTPLPSTLAPGGKATGILLFTIDKSARPESAYYKMPSPVLESNRSHKKRGWFGR